MITGWKKYKSNVISYFRGFDSTLYVPGLMPNDRICESDDNGFDNSDWCNNEKFDDSSLSAVEMRFSVVCSIKMQFLSRFDLKVTINRNVDQV